VADVLRFAGMTLMGQDYTVPAEDEPATAGMTIRVVRVTETLVSETAPLPFETLVQADATRPIDTRGMAQEGREGVQRTVTRVRLEDGVEVARTLAETSVAVPPQHRIITYGTEVVLNTLDTPEGPQVYWRVLRLYATSYHPAALGGDNVTATGRLLEKGIVGADTDLLPFGTQVYVPGYGVGLVADTGAERHDPYWIDLGYSDADWRSWSRPVEVYLLAPPPRQIDYMAGNMGE
jgi:3D (Asp-Asp-Asp) domain-containing protein